MGLRGDARDLWPPMVTTPTPTSMAASSRAPNHILLFRVLEPRHPITTTVLEKICSGLAYVVRIVIIRKNRVR